MNANPLPPHTVDILGSIKLLFAGLGDFVLAHPIISAPFLLVGAFFLLCCVAFLFERPPLGIEQYPYVKPEEPRDNPSCSR